jgi:hypothetical protein
MIYNKSAYALLFIVSIATVSQSALIHQRDTLHILSTYGRGASFSANGGGQFIIDSIGPLWSSYPCSLSYKGIFIASLGGFFACPCCPTWSIGSPRPFYRPEWPPTINWSAPLRLTDSLQFSKFDTSKSQYYCSLPQAIPNSFYDSIYVFSTTSVFNRPTYLLVRVVALYLNPAKPTQTGGGALGYPVETCKNMLVVDLFLQTDGSTNFSGAQITPILVPNRQAREEKRSLLEASTVSQVYDLQGRSVSIARNGTPSHIPPGCYLQKYGAGLKKLAVINP